MLVYSLSSQSTGCVGVSVCLCVCVGGLLLPFSVSARFFNFTPHFPPVIQPHTSTDFMGNRQAAGLSAAPFSPAGMHDHRHYTTERTRGGITNYSLQFGERNNQEKQQDSKKRPIK